MEHEPRSADVELAEWMRFVRSEAHVLCRHPDPIFQQAANQPYDTPPVIAAKGESTPSRVAGKLLVVGGQEMGGVYVLCLEGNASAVA